MCKLCDKINDKEFQEMLDSDPELKIFLSYPH